MARNPNYTATVSQKTAGDYVVKTNLPPDKLSELSAIVFEYWMKFALGQESLGGKRLKLPTGRYASSLQYKTVGVAKFAIWADPDANGPNSTPEADILEHGMPNPFDLKAKFQQGRSYPMHGFGRGFQTQGGYTGVGDKPQMWAEQRRASFSGWATVASRGWILPPMPAYSPAFILAQLAAEAARRTPR